jgi:GT2 family glycosyltransferase
MTTQTLKPGRPLPGRPTLARKPAEEPVPDGQPAAGTVSVIVPCFGQLELVRLCVPRLVRHGGAPCELVFVDAGSLDGTAEYLAGVADAADMPARVLRTDDDLDLVGACGHALPHARGELVALLAPDALVPEGWLGHLTALARLAPDIGLVGAMCNLAPPPQWVGKLPYRLKPRKDEGTDDGVLSPGPSLDVGPVDAFARDWRDRHRGQSFEAERLGGPCLLFRAEALRKADLAACRTPFGALDGDLVSQQVRRAGYRLACCQDLFVHHLGSRLFAALRVEAAGPAAPPAAAP